MEKNEEQLVARIKAGDETAFARLMEENQKMVFNVALRYTRNYDDASDVSQEAFIKAYRSIDSFKGESKLSTWLYLITVNVCLDFARKNRLHMQSIQDMAAENEDGEPFELPIPDTTYDPGALAEKKELRETILSAVDSLPAASREIVVMRDINGMSYNEIAEALHIELGTVRSRLARARIRLRNKLVKMI